MSATNHGSIESRLAQVEQQFKGRWPQVGAATVDSLIDRLVQLELQVQGLMQYSGKFYHSGFTDNEIMGLKDPAHAIDEARTILEAGDIEEVSILYNDQATQTLDREPQANAEAPNVERRSAVDANKPDVLTKADFEKAKPYEYTPLDPDFKEIRVLALRTSYNEEDAINCRLLVTSLEDQHASRKGQRPYQKSAHENFATLSYTWGKPVLDHEIFVDGCKFQITRSLYKALLHFRQGNSLSYNSKTESQETFWWIDALCINQMDIEEKANQIGLMTSLYKHAIKTHVWLGEEENDSARAIRTIRELAYEPTPGSEEYKTWSYERKPGQTHRPGGPGQPPVELPAESVVSQEERESNLQAIVDLFRRPWFQRAWVRQEIALPADVEFHVGDETCAWSDMMRAATLLSFLADTYLVGDLQPRKFIEDSDIISIYGVVAGLNRMRHLTGPTQRNYVAFDKLVSMSRGCQATDLRDKIYAMLPLSDPDQVPMTADYEKDSRELYKELALILSSSSLDFFTECQNPDRENGMPSWVPDLSRPLQAFTAPRPWDETTDPLEPDPRAGSPRVTFDSHSCALSVFGMIFDRIMEVGTVENLLEGVDPKYWHNFWEDRRGNFEYSDLMETMGEYAYVWDDYSTFENWHITLAFNNLIFENLGSNNFNCERRDVPIEHSIRARKALKLLIDDKNILSSDEIKARPTSGQPVPQYTQASARTLAVGRRVMVSAWGALGLAPHQAIPGDLICRFRGSCHTYVIREVEPDRHVLVGQLYLLCRPYTDLISDYSQSKMITLI